MMRKYAIAGVLMLVILTNLSVYSQNTNAFKFKITGNGYSDETIIRMVNGATQNFDGNYDAWKLFSPNPNVPSIYSQITTGQELSINALPEFSEDKSITIYTNIPTSGTYTLNVEEIFPLTSDYKISLTDITSTTHYRLLGDTVIVFTLNSQQNSPSFIFNISTEITSNISHETCFGSNDGAITINNAGNTDWDVQIFDASNNIVVNSNSTSTSNNYNNLLPGNYNATITSKGIEDDFSFTVNPAVNLMADFNLSTDTIYLNEGGEINIINNSQYAQNYSWDFGDGGSSFDVNPTYNYSSTGEFDITLVASNTNCISEYIKQITVLQSQNVVTSVTNYDSEIIKLSTFGNGEYQVQTVDNTEKSILVYSVNGKLVLNKITKNSTFNISLGGNGAGIYIIKIASKKGLLLNEKVYLN